MPLPGAAPTTTFAAGSLIIPTQGNYQDQCGVAGSYGLLFTVLRANDWLVANGKPRITVHWAINTAKGSPNRCIPTNLHTAPAPSADPRWNDGCDFQITNATATPVRLVDDQNVGSGSDTDIVTNDTTANVLNLSPGYSSVTITHTASVATNVTTVGYLGAPFIISAADAPTFLAMLSGASGYTSMTDANGVAITFAPYRTPASCGSLGAGQHVAIHRVAAPFTAPDTQQFSTLPPRLALLSSGSGVDGGLLEPYLTNAGLTFSGAFGCPTGSTLIGNHTFCPNGAVSGVLYDNFSDADLAAGLLTQTDAHGNQKYKSLWTPHWNIGTTLTASQKSAINNVASFLQDPTHGLTGMCASIGVWEGTVNGSNHAQANTTAAGSFLTCVQDSVNPTICAATQPTTYQGLEQNIFTAGTGKNCTDPDITAGTDCLYFPNPGDPVAQMGDTQWANNGGHITDAAPNPFNNSIFRPGTQPVVGNISGVDLTHPLAGQVLSYTAFHGNESGSTARGTAYYFGGHDYHNDLSGERFMMNTLLNLTTLATVTPVTTEVSRASPIVATVGGATAVVQGTFESVSPAISPTSVTTATDLAGFTFPAERGHLRARTAASISTTASSFSSGTVLFDAATLIPAVTYSGCATPFNGACRTVFTTTSANANGITRLPTRVLVQDGNADAIAGIAAPGLTVHADRVTFVERLLAGVSDGAGGYTAVLGGIDRSTVAVIEASTIAGTARPTIAYVGATDGMLHAICASVQGPCDVIGRELWAFLPRTQLPFTALNTARIDGSPRVVDAFGDFENTGTHRFRTILTFQTGSGTASTPARAPAVYALDITDPANPIILWEYATPTTRGSFELGVGEALAAGTANIAGTQTNLVVAETNNGGTGGAGVVATAINAETGATVWQFTYGYPNPPRVSTDTEVPPSGIPGGAVPVDKAGLGNMTDVVFGDLYGNLWELDPATGASRYGAGTPLFSFTADFHPIGSPPALYSNGNSQFAVISSGGYADPLDTSWATGTQYVVSVALNTPLVSAPLHETSGSPYVPIAISLGAGESGFAQATIVGNQLFITSDSTDVNSTGYGTGGNSGHVYTYNISANTAGATVVVAGGASSVANSGTTLYTSSSSLQQQLTAAATSTVGPKVEAAPGLKLARLLWMRTL